MTNSPQNLQHVGGYELLLELGQGGMGVAYLARALGAGGFERLVVVKRLHKHMLHETEAKRRFLDEARLSGWVRHANVVAVHQAGSDEDGQYLVLEYVEGGSLDELVDRAALRGQMVPTSIVLRVVVDALAGLHAVHEATDGVGRALDILHRDVSPQNILIGRDGVSRMADFGVAKSSISVATTDKSYVVGKLLYMPPEYLRREPIGRTLDVYAMGVTMWCVLSAKDPFPNANEGQLVTHILVDGIPRLAGAAEVPPQVDEIVAKACARDADKRFQSAWEMADAIESLGKATGWVATNAEVSAFVETLMGVDLARRRQRISTEIQKRPSLSGAETPVRAAPAPAAAPAERASAPGGETPVPEPTAMNFSKVSDGAPAARLMPWALVALGTLAIGAAALFLFRSKETATQGIPALAATTRPGKDDSPDVGRAEPPAPKAPGSHGALSPSDLPVAEEEEQDPGKPRSTRPKARAKPPAPRAPEPRASAPAPEPGAPEAPRESTDTRRDPATGSPLDNITKRNPYR